MAIPGTVIVCEYDNGGEGVAYHDVDASNNQSSTYRPGLGVDADGDHVGWTQPSEWMNYTVNVGSAAAYTLTIPVANPGSGATFHINFNGVNKTGTITVPNTGDWGAYQTVTATATLTAGTQVMQIVMDTNSSGGAICNLRNISFSSGSTQTPFSGTPMTIPGTVAVCEYDNGGEGVAFHDVDASNNQSSTYRPGLGVDADGDHVGWTQPSEWMEYTVNVGSAATYALSVPVANPGSGATFHINFDGVNKTGTITVPNTGDWGAYQTVTATATLTAGTQIMQIVMDTNSSGGAVCNLRNIVFSSGSTQTPYNGSPFAVPGTIASAQYDNGGEGVAYHDVDVTNFGSSTYRPGEGVDSSGSGLGWIVAGEWLEYTVNVSVAGTYTLSVPVCLPADGGTMHVSFSGVNATGSMSIPNTGSWSVFQTISKSVTLNAGQQLMLVAFDANASNGWGPGLGDITITGGGNAAPSVSMTSPTNGQTFTAPANITLSATASDSDGTVSKVDFYQGTTPIGTDNTSPYSIAWNSVAAGSYALTAKVTDNAGATTTSSAVNITVATGSTQTPYNGSPFAVPGAIASAQYDNGGEGIAYHDVDVTNFGSSTYRPGEGVDSSGSGLGWIVAGEWLEYTVNVSAAGTYTLSVPVCLPGDGATMHVSFNGVNATGSMSVPNTGSWSVFQTISKSVTLSAGQQIMLVAFDANASNGWGPGLGDLTIAGGGNNAPSVTMTSPTNGQTFTAPANITLSTNASDSDGTVSKVDFYQGTTPIGTDNTSPYSIAWNSVAAGSYALTAKVTDNAGAVTTSASVAITVNPPAGTQTPFSGTPAAIPGTLTIGNYDNGGEGVAYHDTDTANNASSTFRTGLGVDADGTRISWIQPGEWVEYTVNVASAATYTVSMQVANPANGGTFHINFDGVNKTGAITVPNTGNWDVYQTITTTATLSSGQQVMQVYFDTNSPAGAVLNLKDIVFSVTGGPSAAIYVVARETVYRNGNATGPIVTNYAYTWRSGTNLIATKQTTYPAVPTSQNGSGIPTATTQAFDTYGRPAWTRDADNYLTYSSYDPVTGALVRTIVDVDTSKTADFSDLPAGWTTPSGGGLHLKRTIDVDRLGRPIKMVNPKGSVTYVVYRDPQFEVRTYPAWNSSTLKPTGPTVVMREDRANNYRESLTMSATPAVSGGLPTGGEAIANLESLSRQYLDLDGRVVTTDDYVSFANLSYATVPSLGTLNTHFYRSTIVYDARGRAIRAVDGAGTIRRTVVDVLSRPVSAWTGINDTVSGTWSASNPGGMVQISATEYDGNGIGNGAPTRVMAMSGSANYATVNQYDYRDRLIQSTGPDNLTRVLTLDNLGRTTRAETYAGGVTAANLRGRSDAAFDERGLVYQSTDHQVDPITGVVGNMLVSRSWYNARGLAVKTRNPAGLMTKISYDGAGRARRTSIACDGSTADSTYADALTTANNQVIEATATIFDAASNPICVTAFKRHPFSAPIGDLTTLNSYYTVAISWFDSANRLISSANYGRDNGATRYVYNASGALIGANGVSTEAVNAPRAPNTSDDYIVTKVDYDSAGRAYRTTDNLARIRQNVFDAQGRVLKTIENYVDGVVAVTETDSDRTTESVYGPGGVLTKQIAHNPNGSSAIFQATAYVYESPFDKSLATSIIYPDSADATSAGSDQVKIVYDRLGRKLSSTDQRGVVHTYTYDFAGRMFADTATVVPADVNGAVRRLETAYDALGRIATVSSFDAASGGNVLNQVSYAYNGYGVKTKTTQSHSGPVTASSPAVGYVYEDGASAGVARYVRLKSVTYPSSGRTVDYFYDVANSIGDCLNRIEGVFHHTAGSVGSVDYSVGYSVLGADTIAAINFSYTDGTVNNKTLAALDYGMLANYAGWDRFGRILQKRWMSGTTVLEGADYTYNRLGNRLSRNASWTGHPSNQDFFLSYDKLNRIDISRRGDLSSGTISAANATASKTWTLDAVGNWRTYAVDSDGGGANAPLTQTRIHNKANEIDVDDIDTNAVGASISGSGINWRDPSYTQAGSLKSSPQVANETTTLQHYVYDAWNRLVEVRADNAGVPGALATSCVYDALGRRIRYSIVVSGVTTSYDSYYDDNYRELEVRRNNASTAMEQYIYHAFGTDDVLARYRDPANAGTLNEHLSYLQDAQHNVTALLDDSGAVVERNRYEPYGVFAFLTPSGGSRSASSYDNRITYSGRKYDFEARLFNFRARYYDPSLGRFTTRDPMGYVDGMSLYEYVRGNPWNLFDPMGLCIGPNATALEPLDIPHPWSRSERVDVMRCHGARQEAGGGFGGLLGPGAEMAAGFVPLVGEGMDVYSLMFGDSWSERGMALVSLGLNAFTGGLAPNFGGPASRIIKNETENVIPSVIYRTGSHTDNALTDATGVSFRDSISSSADGAQVFRPGDKLWAVDTSLLPQGSVITDGVPHGHVTVTATPQEIRNAILSQSSSNPLGETGLKQLEDGASYRIPK